MNEGDNLSDSICKDNEDSCLSPIKTYPVNDEKLETLDINPRTNEESDDIENCNLQVKQGYCNLVEVEGSDVSTRDSRVEVESCDMPNKDSQVEAMSLVVSAEDFQIDKKSKLASDNSRMEDSRSDCPTRNIRLKKETSNSPSRRNRVEEVGSNSATRRSCVEEVGSNSPTRKSRVEVGSNSPTRKSRVEEVGSNSPTRKSREEEVGSNSPTRKSRVEEVSSNSPTGHSGMEEGSSNVQAGNIPVVLTRKWEAEDFEDDNMFVQDLFLLVYQRRRWDKKKPFIVKPIPNSPLTTELRQACAVLMEYREVEMYFVFMNEIGVNELGEEMIDSTCELSFSVLKELPFCPRAFLWLCLILCNHAALAINRGIFRAGRVVMENILGYLLYLRNRGEFSDDFWLRIAEAADEMASKAVVELVEDNEMSA